MSKTITIDQFLTPEELNRAAVLYARLKDTGLYASTVAEELIQPNLQRINLALGQENDPNFLAYAVEYVMIQLERAKAK